MSEVLTVFWCQCLGGKVGSKEANSCFTQSVSIFMVEFVIALCYFNDFSDAVGMVGPVVQKPSTF
jgi:hypothetical protein